MSDATGFDTLAIHAGRALAPTSGFVSADAGGGTDPTLPVLEERIAALEGGTAALAVASAHLARLLAFRALMTAGDEFVASTRLGDGAGRQFAQWPDAFGWHVRAADPFDLDAVEAAVGERTRAIFVESIADGVVSDIAGIAGIAHRHGLPLLVENTSATPYLCRPIEHGADVVVHSLAEFIGAHRDATGGAIVDCGTFDWSAADRYPLLSRPRDENDGVSLHDAFGNAAFVAACRMLAARDLGSAIAPPHAALVLQGVETLPLRMRRQCDSALAVAEFLAGHGSVAWVSYAGLADDPSHGNKLAFAPNGAGAVLAFGLAGGGEAVAAFLDGLELFSLRAEGGDTRSRASHPTALPHRGSGAEPNVVRLSIGLESVGDIIADLDRALTGTGNAP